MIPGDPGGDTEPPALRYVYVDTDPVVGDCHRWSAVPGGIDAWAAGSDPAVIAAVTGLPLCPGSAVPPSVEDLAWDIFRSFPMTGPEPAMQPPDGGVTRLPTHLSSPVPGPFTHAEVLPDGRTLEVRAVVASLTVDWGDGAVTIHAPAEARPFPDGAVAHEYLVKTCSTGYRVDHPRGDHCHPDLEAYPITATYTWVGEWTVGAAWTTLGFLDLAATLAYDVDEVLGVLEP